MPHVSRVKLDHKVERDLLKTLEFVLTRLTKEEEMNGFMLSLMTPTERLMFSKRLAIIIMLKEGLPDSHISAILHVTRGTVARMQLFLETSRSGGYEHALRKLQNEKIVKELKEALINLAGYAARAAGGRVKPSII
ncbi:MAG: helix-turn-helix domain-containing protein [Patescibacteria group bacterium]